MAIDPKPRSRGIPSQEPVPCRVGVDHAAGGVNDADPDRKVTQGGGQPLLAFAQRLLRFGRLHQVGYLPHQ